MTRRFVDTFYYLALLNPRDQHHDEVLQFHASLTGQTITTDAVLLETANALAATSLRVDVVELIQIERSSPDVTVVPWSPQLLDRGLAFYAARRDKAWSLTDCISFIIMGDEAVFEALTADTHFDQAGFRAMFASS